MSSPIRQSNILFAVKKSTPYGSGSLSKNEGRPEPIDMKVYLERADEGGGKIEILRQGIAGFLVACGTQEGFSVAEQIEVIEDVLAELRTLPSEPQGSPPEPSRGDCVILQFPKAR